MHKFCHEFITTGNWLVIDAAGPQTQIGLWNGGKWLAFNQNPDEALNAIFAGVSDCLDNARISLESIDGYIYGEGPGSTLGIRVAAMAIDSWQAIQMTPKPVLSYTTLEAGACLIEKAPRKTLVLAPWKTGWFSGLDLSFDSRNIMPYSAETIESDFNDYSIYLINCGRRPKSIPQHWITLEYDLGEAKSLFLNSFTLEQVDHPRPYQIEDPVYQKWTPQRHGAS